MALMKFVQYENQDKFQILEHTPPSSAPHSPVLSASPGLFFSRLRPKHEVDDEIDFPFSPCSSSTPEKSSSPSRARCNDWPCRRLQLNKEASEANARTMTTTQPSKRPLKRKGLSVVDANVSPTGNKRFRFEEHCFNYEKKTQHEKRLVQVKDCERIEREQQEGQGKSQLEKRIMQIRDELEEATCKLIALESVDSPRVKPEIQQVCTRRRALRAFNRVLQKELADSKAKKILDFYC